jgi:hypothetical protein
MGIRPQFHVIVGIDNAKEDDPRYNPPDEGELEEMLYHRKLTEEECYKKVEVDDFFIWNDYRDTDRDLYNMLYNPTFTDEFMNEGVIGYIVVKGKYDDMIIRALASIDDKYMTTGYTRLPLLDPVDNRLRYSRYGYTDEDIAANRFVSGVFENIPQVSRINWERAKHYMKLVGWTVEDNDLRYILVWTWS